MIKKMFNYGLLLPGIFLIISCSKDYVTDEPELIPDNYVSADSVYDKNVGNIALALHASMGDQKFRTLLRNEINRKADGDYDVLLKSFLKKNIEFSNTPLFSTLSGKTMDSKGIYPDLLAQYPNLQVSIPVHAEKWDGSEKLWILYLPSGYEEFSKKKVPAISPTGAKALFNVENEPDFPVIVIGQNERSNKNGDLKFEYNLLKEKVDFNILALNTKSGEGFISFAATPVTNAMAVSLSWTFSYPDYLAPYDHYFEIYRDDMTGSGFQKIAEAESWQTSYYDTRNLLPTRTYIYYVAAKVDYYQTYNHAYYEEYFYSNTDEAAIPQIPNFTNNFSVNCIGPYFMSLAWSINNISNWTNLKIERYNAYTPGYQYVADLPITSIHYDDDLTGAYPSYGVKYRYRLTVSNSTNGATQETYCEEMLSNRIDCQFLRLTRIQFNSFDDMRRYEGWLNGGPEVQLFVNKVVNDIPKLQLKDDNIGGPASSGFPVNITIGRWDKAETKVFTISLNEVDGGNWEGIDINLGTAVKLPKLLGTEVSVNFGIKTTLLKGNRDEFIGTGYLYWWDNADGRDVPCGSFCRATVMSVEN